ncbi:glutathione S-transferase family protein [Caenimonas sedimenti]|uniref:Glutathione S-transferase family protein n=1 Tax=Caenimonas sedimenti TaxID=2596921 RepID=A0A562ZMD2_9BURK|nr:glutathione S-transferase family protein [Caenimonas sedimenti]TWO69488.1 glutathione S-transferase family protein [Caenimonas sedimenti]
MTAATPILLYGFPAGSSMGLVAALEWLGQPYRLCRVDMLGEMRDATYARVNARHETPVLITGDGRPLTETLAIAAWLEARDEARRISFAPRTPQADRMHQLMAFINTGFTGAFSPLWTAMEMDPPDPAFQAALRRHGREAVIERHDKLEAMVGDGPYLVGDRPTLADGAFIGVARWLDLHEVADKARWPRLAALRARLEADEAVRFALAMEDGEQPAGSGALVGQVPLREVIAAQAG